MTSNIGRTGFIAYPASPEEIGLSIEQAVNLMQSKGIEYGSWRALPVGGQIIPEVVSEGISSSSIFVADITQLNLNVVYEIGLAIAKSIPIVLIKNSTIQDQESVIQSVGLFETIGYDNYCSANDLATILQAANERKPITNQYSLNPNMPIYTVLPKLKNDIILKIPSRLKRSKLKYRAFDAGEQTRLSVNEAVQKVVESYGIVLFLLPNSHPESYSHNLRTMFVAGLSVGLDKPLKLLSMGLNNSPMDVANIILECKFPAQIEEAITDLAVDVTEAFQTTIYEEGAPKTQLEKIDLGASSAENELSKLTAYYLQTDAYQKTLRGEISLVVGRKGSGKSAIFYQVTNKLLQNKKRLVVDLKPEGFQLISLKDNLANLLASGSVEHIITSFWEYILYCEIANNFLIKTKNISFADPVFNADYTTLQNIYSSHGLSKQGDFSERIIESLKKISDQLQEMRDKNPTEDLNLTSPQVSNIVHKGIINDLQTALYNCLKHQEAVWILFDNIDKGWPVHGLSSEDILVIRTLQDAARKVTRNFNQKKIDCYSVIFLRNDVYELLVSETPDRGKEAKVLLDWKDRDQLKELLRKRLVYSGLPSDRSIDELWRSIATHYINGLPSLDYILDRCLMRPRFLLDLVNYCKSTAVNVQHSKIETEDIQKGLASFSADLVIDISYEIADVLGSDIENAEKLLFKFMRCDQLLTEKEFDEIIGKNSLEDKIYNQIYKIFIWHGVLGLCQDGQVEARYIYDYNYNYTIMDADITVAKSKANIYYRINDAFCVGLQLSSVT